MYQLETRFARINQCQLRRAEQSLHFASMPINFSIFIILRPRPRTYASSSPLLLLQLYQQQQLLSINITNSTNHHLQHAKLRILLQHLASHAAYERSGGPPKRRAAKAAGRQSGGPPKWPAAKRTCIKVLCPKHRTISLLRRHTISTEFMLPRSIFSTSIQQQYPWSSAWRPPIVTRSVCYQVCSFCRDVSH